MLHLARSLKNIFRHSRQWSDEADYREYVLQKIFPAIRYDRDNDLERYIMLRESGKPSKEWGGYYSALCLRYTEAERKRLIRFFRKNSLAFQNYFKLVLNNLYERLHLKLLERIDQLITCLKKIEKSQHRMLKSSQKDIIAQLEKMLALCSPQLETASEGADFLLEFANHYRYNSTKMRRVVKLVKGYLDGSLFEEVQVKEAYHFDIKEERKKYQRSVPEDEQPFRLQIFISPTDIEEIVISSTDKNEYELALAYFECYLPKVADKEFATRVYVYAKKYNTYHFKIYEVIRKGLQYNHQKGRIFDDIFKIISGGRYVFNIRSEQEIQEKLKVLGTAKVEKQIQARVSRPLLRERLGVRRGRVEGPGRLLRTSALEAEALTGKTSPPPLMSEEPKQVEKQETLEKKTSPSQAAAQVASLISKEPKALTTDEMWREFTQDRRAARLMRRRFRELLPERLLGACREQVNTLFADLITADKLKELLYYVRHNYDRIIAHDDERALHKERLEELGVSIALVYTVIMECVNEVKAEYASGKLRSRGFFKKA